MSCIWNLMQQDFNSLSITELATTCASVHKMRLNLELSLGEYIRNTVS